VGALVVVLFIDLDLCVPGMVMNFGSEDGVPMKQILLFQKFSLNV
jgi:hypothetical protein